MEKFSNSLVISVLGIALWSCSQARFETVEHGGDGSAEVIAAEALSETHLNEILPNIAGQEVITLECNGLEVGDYPRVHQRTSLNPADRSQPQAYILRFDNPRIINLLDHRNNAEKSIAFTSWARNQRTSVFVNTLESSWQATSPTDPEVTCFLKKETATPTNPPTVGVENAGFEVATPDKIRANFSTHTDGYELRCQKNANTRAGSPSPLTLEKINKTLCGIATVYIDERSQ